MSKHGKAYFGLPWIVSVILAIIPVTCWVLGILTCISRGKLLGAVLRFFGMLFGILWICDIVTMILSKDIKIFA